jgi:probable DNA repair protein
LRETCTDTVTWRDLATLARSDDDLAALAARLEAAASTLNAERGPANLWAERCSRALTQLEWPGPDAAQSTTQQIRAQWTALLRDFAGLSRVLGPVTAPRAVDTLSAMARQQSYAPATGDVAVLVTESLDDPVTRYDGIWVCGLQAERWPMPTRVDPFIPWYLQQQAQVGDATATGCLQRAQRQLEAWRRATPQLVLSHARFDGDAELAASPLLSAWPAEALDAQPVSLAARLRASAPALLELRADPAGLRWNPQLPLPHGTRSLELQNTCAFRAYAELRLGAREPEVRAPGISPKERGILLHAVLQQVWQRLLGQQQLRATTPTALEALLDAAVEVAAQQWLQAGAATVDRRAWQRELQRARAVAQSLLARELERAAFAIHELESARELQVGAARLRLRIDRVDRLEDGRLVLIDYKTGAAATHDWFGPRADPVQLFIYLAALAEATTPVAALGTVHLVRRGRVFVAVGADDGLLPGARQVVDWPGQLQRWHEQVERLAEQFLAGTATLDPVAGACRRCHLAGLCRRSELLEPRDEREPDADEEAELESR